MSSIVSFLQNELLSLSSEAKKRHPDIKESSERVILILRPLKDLSTSDICLELSKFDEIMTPFILACDTRQPRLVSIAVGSLQRLVSHKAISDDEPTLQKLIRALNDVTSVSVDVQVKSLQILLPLLTQYQNLHLTLIAEMLNLCFQFCNLKDALVCNLAAATLRQLVIFLFDKVTAEDESSTPAAIPDDLGSVKLGFRIESLRPCARDAYLVFKDLCELANYLEPEFLGIQSIPRGQCLELLESILQNHYAVFECHLELSDILTKSVCPMVINTFLDRYEFAHSVRLNRIISILIQKFHSMLTMECEVFISLFLRAINDDVDQFYSSAAMALEILYLVCSQPKLLVALFSTYDLRGNGVIQSIVSCYHKIITNSHATLMSSANVRVQCIDMLDKSEIPVLPDDYLVYLAMQSTFALISTMNELSNEKETVVLVTSIWSPIVAILSHLLKSPMASETVAHIKQFILVSGRVHCTEPRNTALQLLAQCVTCISVGDPITLIGSGCLQALFSVAVDLVSSLDTNAWLTVFEVAVHAERIKHPRHAMHVALQQQKLPTSVPSPALATRSPSSASMEVVDVEGHVRVILAATRDLNSDALTPIFTALCQFSSIHSMTFAIDKLRELVVMHLHRLITELNELWTLVMQHFVFIASTTQSIELQLQACDNICQVVTHGITESQAKALAPLHDLAALSGDVPKRALQTLHSILQVHGQVITEWMQVYGILQSSANEEYLVRVAFPSLELICTEYLPTPTAAGELDQCIATLRIYATQSVDVNISLTCIRLLWTIADSTTSRKTHWLTVLSQLTLIGRDRRPQVRNGCVASLFRAIASSGKRLLKEDQWDTCVYQVILPVLETTLQSNDAAPVSAQPQGVVMHHARDTSEKQWDETRVLAIQGLTGLVSLDMCVSMVPTQLARILDMVVRYVLETALEVRSAALALVLQLASYKEGPPLLYAFVYDAWTLIVCGIVEDLDRCAGGHEKPGVVSHEFVLILVHIMRELPAPLLSYSSKRGVGQCIAKAFESSGSSEPTRVPVTEVVPQLESILKQVLAQAPDHPNDTERASAVQSGIVQVVNDLCKASNNQPVDYPHLLTLVQFLHEVAKLPIVHQATSPKTKNPTYLAIARIAMTSAIELIRTCIPVPENDRNLPTDAVVPRPLPSSLWTDQVFVSTVSGIEPYLMIAHPLHDHAVQSLLDLVRYYFPLTAVGDHAVSEAIQTLIVQAVDRYLVTRPRAFESSEERDISALDALVAHIPFHVTPSQFNLMLQSVEISARIEANTVLDASISHAVHAFIAEKELALIRRPSTPHIPSSSSHSPTVSIQTLQLPPLPPSIPTTPMHHPTMLVGAGTDIEPFHQSQVYNDPVRERYFQHAIRVLFTVAAKRPEIGVPIVIDRVVMTMSTYVQDHARTGGVVPLDRMRMVEMELVLQLLVEFVPVVHARGGSHGLFMTLVDSIAAVKDHPGVLQGVCNCLRVLSKDSSNL